MKKRISLLLALAGMAVLCCMGCTSEGKLTMTDGVLSWDPVEKAAYYEVKLNEVQLTCNEPKVNLSEVCEYEGDYTVTVSSVTDSGKKKEISSMEIEAQYAEEPEIIITDSDGKKSFTWEAGENVVGYAYDLYDGFGSRAAKTEDDQIYRVEFDGGKATMITVTAKGGSKDNVVFIDKEANYQYDGTEIFSLAELVNYPFYYTSTGDNGTFTVGTTLERGSHEVELCLYVMDSRGMTLTGNGTWGRRFLDANNKLSWFCTTAVEGWPESGNTVPIANQIVKKEVKANVNKYGEMSFSIFNFLEGEMLVVADVLENGKSVIADKPAVHDPKDDIVFDVAKLDEFLAVFTGKGDTGIQADREFVIPVDLEDGVYRLEFSYQLMDASGKGLTGNGAWGRRIGDVDMAELTWWCEYKLEPHTEGIVNMPSPVETLKTELPVVVESRKCKILCMSFAKGEIMAVSAVKKISGSSAKFDISTLKNYNNVFVSKGQAERFRVETSIYERGRFELEITYYAMDAQGRMLSGNGTWGRRMMDEKDEIWLCQKAPSADYPEAENTVPEPDKTVTTTITVSVNKKGRFFLDMYNFKEGETIVITDIKYQGKSVIVN